MSTILTPNAPPPDRVIAVQAEDERLLARFVAKYPHLSFGNLTRGATFWLCSATWREIALAWARHDEQEGKL